MSAACTVVYIDQVLTRIHDFVRAVSSPETIDAADVSVEPDDGGCVCTVKSIVGRMVEVTYAGQTVGAYSARLAIDTSNQRSLEVCSPIVVLAAPAVAPVDVYLNPGETENFGFDYAFRMKTGEALLEAAATVPLELDAVFTVDPNNTQQVLGTIAVLSTTGVGAYPIELSVTTNLSQPFVDRLLVIVEECGG